MTVYQEETSTIPRSSIRSRARALLETGKTVEKTCDMTGLDRSEVVRIAVGQGWRIDPATGLATVTGRTIYRHADPAAPREQVNNLKSHANGEPKGFRLHGALCVQRGMPIFQAFAPIRLLARQAAVDEYNPHTSQGYQRALTTSRIPKMAAYYELGGRMPNAIMMNIRNVDFKDVFVKITQGDQGAYEQAIAERGNWMGAGEIMFGTQLRLWVYDGQHRKAALAYLLKNYEEDFAGFPVPIGITLGLPREQETREFYEVNTNGVNVRTDLAWTLLAGLASNDADLRASLATNGKEWVTRGAAVVAALTSLDGPWQGRFLLANSRKRKGDGVTIRKAQFIRSLRPVLEAPLFKRASNEDIASVINSYWIGISKVLPESFAGDPSEYVIQKGVGVSALHQVLPQAVEIARSRGHKLADPSAYSDIMKPLRELSGHAIISGRQVPCSGAEFWRSQSAATCFSGNTGRHRLVQMLQNILPSPENTHDLY